MSDRNMFGGGNARSLYTPMSEDEQEVLARLVAEGDFKVEIVGWGVVHRPKVTFGDLRVQVPIQITFSAPEVPILVSSFALKLWTGSGLLLFGKEYDIRQGNFPIAVGAGYCFSMVWDIAIKHMDPKLVRALKPGATGLTSRWQDRDTGEFTARGNTRLSPAQRTALRGLRQGEEKVRALDVQRLASGKTLK